MTEKTRSPEFHLAQNALQGLRTDLFHDAFAYRPLPPLSPSAALVQWLPGRIRRFAVWFPHAVVLAMAGFTLMITYAASYSGFGASNEAAGIVTSVIPAATVALTLVRPLLAWWLSLLVTPFLTAVTSGTDYPWSPGSFAGHIAVMMVVAARTRPRTAAWMWVITALYSLVAESGGTSYGSNSGSLVVVSGLAVALVTLAAANFNTRREVVAERTVTAVERDKRTLLEERTNIARELHDVVAHHMSVVAIQAEAAPYRVENPPPELAQAFATIRENAVIALTELRRVLGVVRAEDYEAPDAPQPTLADIGRLLDNVRDTGLAVEKVVTGAARELPQGVELSAYRIVQEALSNSLRHAPGATARVEIGYVLGGLGLRVVNGPATEPVKPSPGAGHGITGMRERVTMLDGEMTAEETADGGYEVTVFLPVPLDTPKVAEPAQPVPAQSVPAQSTGAPKVPAATPDTTETLSLDKPGTGTTGSARPAGGDPA
ncbi:sensor histidine kinase [Streptomyces flavofungini]|uniref:histidine kinase n=1 Tax=Streptomyces flavofungini TaxID=68200 RepID=A0ABS0WXM6_9ACTN|nr:histidine kinase [Streptomyces flavofungini]MBJ3805687.1 two-component sensor histidine kinase [Streptomyces flavofungini]GHC72375.1 two-component sensor histidine kinase [Streptomyces flavofungini]